VKDVSLSYKLLKLVNSSAFGFRSRIDSVKHALVILGMTEMRKWISLIALRGISEGKPDELVRLSLIRARFAESLSILVGWKNKSDDAFLMELFSLLDVLMNRSLEEILKGVPVSIEVSQALLHKEGLFGFLHQLILAYESGSWDEVTRISTILDIRQTDIADAYFTAITWCNVIMES
jgi:c-di-GMP-related signal transduction protein